MGPRAIRAGKAFVSVDLDPTELQKGLRNIGRRISVLGQRVAGIGAGLAAGGAALATPFVAATRVFADFDDQTRQLGGVLGTTVDQIGSLVDQAQQLGRETAFTAGQVAQLQTELAKLGFDNSEIEQMSESLLSLGSITRAELGDVAAIAGSTLRAFGLDASETQRVVDVMAKSFSSSSLDLEKFSVSMSKVAPIARNLGFSLEDTTSILGNLSNAGIDASTAGTSLRSLFLNIADPASDLSKALGEPVTSIEQLGPALQRLQDEGINVAEALELTDKRSVTAFLSILNGSEALTSLSATLQDSAGFAAAAAQEMEGGLGGAVRRLRSAIEGAAISIGTALAPTLSAVADRISSLTGVITRFVENNQGMVQSVLAVAAALGGGGVLLTAVGSAITAIGLGAGGLATVVGALGTAFTVIATPGGAIAIATAALAAMIAMAADAAGVFDGIKREVSLLSAGLGRELPSAIKDAQTFVENGQLVNAFKRVFLTIRLELQKTLGNMLEDFRRLALQVSTLGFGGGIADAINDNFDNVFEKNQRLLQNQIFGLREAAKDIRFATLEADAAAASSPPTGRTQISDEQAIAEAAVQRAEQRESSFLDRQRQETERAQRLEQERARNFREQQAATERSRDEARQQIARNQERNDLLGRAGQRNRFARENVDAILEQRDAAIAANERLLAVRIANAEREHQRRLSQIDKEDTAAQSAIQRQLQESVRAEREKAAAANQDIANRAGVDAQRAADGATRQRTQQLSQLRDLNSTGRAQLEIQRRITGQRQPQGPGRRLQNALIGAATNPLSVVRAFQQNAVNQIGANQQFFRQQLQQQQQMRALFQSLQNRQNQRRQDDRLQREMLKEQKRGADAAVATANVFRNVGIV